MFFFSSFSCPGNIEKQIFRSFPDPGNTGNRFFLCSHILEIRAAGGRQRAQGLFCATVDYFCDNVPGIL